MYFFHLNFIAGYGAEKASLEVYKFVKQRVEPNEVEKLLMELLEDELSKRQRKTKKTKKVSHEGLQNSV